VPWGRRCKNDPKKGAPQRKRERALAPGGVREAVQR
jgi:hypothetical protein